MADAIKKLMEEDVKVGMRVSDKQLSNIYDKLIILVNTKDIGMETFGDVAYIGNDVPDNIIKIRESTGEIMSIFNDLDEARDEVVYDE